MIRKLIAGAVLAFAIAGAAPSTAFAATGENKNPDCAAYKFVSSGKNLCDKFPGDYDRDCKHIQYPVKRTGQGDPWGLDRDGDGYGCDGGTKPSQSPSTKPPTTPPTTAPTTNPPTTPTTSPTATTAPPTTPPVTEPTATSSATATEVPADAGDELPLTGPDSFMVGGLIAVGVVAIGIGALAVIYYRRNTRFEA